MRSGVARGMSKIVSVTLEAGDFVPELARRIDQAYPATLASITKAIAGAAGGSPELICAMRNPLTRSGFMLGCVAEEIVSVSNLMEDKFERAFIRDVIEELRPFIKPLPAKRIGPDLRSLIRDFKEQPNRMRVKSVRYMLQLNGLLGLADKIELSQGCALAIECTVATDEIAGILWDKWTGETKNMQLALKGAGASRTPITLASERRKSWDRDPRALQL